MKARVVVGVVMATLLLCTPRLADAFCGFYVSGTEGKLYADATQVVMMREGTRTVLAMQNDYQGPASDFAMVVPVPVVLQKENVKTLSKALFEKVDQLSAPRLVEYWEQDPCPRPSDGSGDLKLGGGARPAKGGMGGGLASIGGATDTTVKVEAQFEVGEYEILILSAQDSGGLDRWLRAHGYKIPDNAEPALRPYVQAGSKFFVAKVDVTKVKLQDGRAQLSPLRFHYDADTFTLPVRLGMLNSSGTQDLIVQILAPRAQRYVVTNYPTATIPTNLDVAESARKSFPTFYAALFDKTLEKTPRAVVTEYAWGATSCDPCPGTQQGLTTDELATLGADVLPSAKIGPILEDQRSGRMGGPLGVVSLGAPQLTGGLDPTSVPRIVAGMRAKFRACYQVGLNNDPAMAGSLEVKFEVDATGDVSRADARANKGLSPAVATCIANAAKRSSFPAGAPGSVTLPLTFGRQGDDKSPSAPTAPPKIGLVSIGADFVLTRLHTRYARGALADDLVFKAAGKITGGREERGATGALETGAAPASLNAFQARYAIRHAWQGPIACERPVRGVWGGPWPDAVSPARSPLAATKLAYAPRGGATLASFVPNGVPELAVVGAVPPAAPESGGGAGDASSAASTGDASAAGDGPDGGATSGGPDGGGAAALPSPRGSRCGCTVIGRSGERSLALGAAVSLTLALGARRRRRARG